MVGTTYVRRDSRVTSRDVYKRKVGSRRRARDFLINRKLLQLTATAFSFTSVRALFLSRDLALAFGSKPYVYGISYNVFPA